MAHLSASENGMKIQRKGFSFEAFLLCVTVVPGIPLHN